jgi:hypothetical protein
MYGEKRKPLQAEGDGSVANGESRKRGRFEVKVVKYNQPGYTYLAVIPDTMDVMKVVNFGDFIVDGWNGQFHAWDKTYTMVDAPEIIYVDPDIVMPDVLDFLPRILAPPNKRKAATAGLDKRQGEQTKRVCGARDIPHRVLPVLGKRKFDDDGDEESKQSKLAVYEDERPIKRLKTSHQALKDLEHGRALESRQDQAMVGKKTKGHTGRVDHNPPRRYHETHTKQKQLLGMTDQEQIPTPYAPCAKGALRKVCH